MVLLSNDEKKFYIRLIEAIIFYEGKPVDVAYCSKLCQIDEDTCLQLMLELKKELQFSNRGILLEQQNESFFYIINPDIKDSFKKLYKIRAFRNINPDKCGQEPGQEHGQEPGQMLER